MVAAHADSIVPGWQRNCVQLVFFVLALHLAIQERVLLGPNLDLVVMLDQSLVRRRLSVGQQLLVHDLILFKLMFEVSLDSSVLKRDLTEHVVQLREEVVLVLLHFLGLRLTLISGFLAWFLVLLLNLVDHGSQNASDR